MRAGFHGLSQSQRNAGQAVAVAVALGADFPVGAPEILQGGGVKVVIFSRWNHAHGRHGLVGLGCEKFMLRQCQIGRHKAKAGIGTACQCQRLLARQDIALEQCPAMVATELAAQLRAA